MKTIWGLKDTLKVRLVMKEMNIRPELHPMDDGGNESIRDVQVREDNVHKDYSRAE